MVTSWRFPTTMFTVKRLLRRSSSWRDSGSRRRSISRRTDCWRAKEEDARRQVLEVNRPAEHVARHKKGLQSTWQFAGIECSLHAAVSEREIDEGVRDPPQIDCTCGKEPLPGNPSHFPLPVDGDAAPLVDVAKRLRAGAVENIPTDATGNQQLEKGLGREQLFVQLSDCVDGEEKSSYCVDHNKLALQKGTKKALKKASKRQLGRPSAITAECLSPSPARVQNRTGESLGGIDTLSILLMTGSSAGDLRRN